MTENEPTKDLTANLTDRQLLELLLERVLGLETRLDRLETRFDGRDTNPLLPPNFPERFTALEQEMVEVKKELRLNNRKFDKLGADVLETYAQQRDMAERVEDLERRAA